MSSENDSLLPSTGPRVEDGGSNSVTTPPTTFYKAYGKKIAIATLFALVFAIIGIHTLPREENGALDESSTTDLAFSGSLYSANSGNNQNSNQIIYLDRHNVNCGSNYLTRFRVSGAIRIDYHCMAMDNFNNGHNHGVTQYTSYAHGGAHKVNYLDRQSIYCPADQLLSQYKMQTAWGYRFRYQYTCGKRNWQSLTCSSHSTSWNDFDSLKYLDRHDVNCDGQSNKIMQGFDVDSGRKWGKTGSSWGCRGWSWWGCSGGWGWSDTHGWIDQIKYNYKCCSINAFPPTPVPVAHPTPVPVATPTLPPVANPTMIPVADPTMIPIADPTLAPTTLAPVAEPSDAPTLIPIAHPTLVPVANPTQEPTEAPVVVESGEPTEAPVAKPTDQPTLAPVTDPTEAPVADPTDEPTLAPVATPTKVPITPPTLAPVAVPTVIPTEIPSLEPVAVPTVAPSLEPVAVPTLQPTVYPTEAPVAELTEMPTINLSPIACKVEFTQQADAYTKDLAPGCGIVAVDDIGYTAFSGTSTGLIVCGSTKIADITAVNIGLPMTISYLYSAPKMQMEIYKEKGAEGNPSLSWTNGLTGFIHTPDHDSVGGINFESTADENVALPTTCKLGTKLELPAAAPTMAPKLEEAEGNNTKAEEEPAFDSKPLPEEDEVTDEGEEATEGAEGSDDTVGSASEVEGVPEGKEEPSEEEIAKKEAAADAAPEPTEKPKPIVNPEPAEGAEEPVGEEAAPVKEEAAEPVGEEAAPVEEEAAEPVGEEAAPVKEEAAEPVGEEAAPVEEEAAEPVG
jgi:hypothetical protein